MNGCRIHGAAKRSSRDARSPAEILSFWKGYILARMCTKFNANAAFEIVEASIATLTSIADDAERAVAVRIARLPIATTTKYAPHRAYAESASFLY
jgi:hypothetical protein